MNALRWFLGRSMEQRPVRWVAQEEGKGCAIACTAMVMGTSYWGARALFPHFDPAEGVTPLDAIRVLGEYGWAGVEKFPHYSPERRDRPRWPVPPFAPLHLVQVVSDAGWHAVVMLEDGAVLDPLFDPTWHLARSLAAYPRVLSITGLWGVR